MRADIVNEVAKILDIKRKDLIEKDLILHQILFDLSGDRFFAAISLEDVDSGALFCYIEEGHTHKLVVLNHEVNHLFP